MQAKLQIKCDKRAIPGRSRFRLGACIYKRLYVLPGNQNHCFRPRQATLSASNPPGTRSHDPGV